MESATRVKKSSRVTAYGTATSSIQRGCVKVCTRSATFQRRPNPLTQLSTVRRVM